MRWGGRHGVTVARVRESALGRGPGDRPEGGVGPLAMGILRDVRIGG